MKQLYSALRQIKDDAGQVDTAVLPILLELDWVTAVTPDTYALTENGRIALSRKFPPHSYCPHCLSFVPPTHRTPVCGVRGVYVCPKCDGVGGRCLSGELGKVVRPFYSRAVVPRDRIQPYRIVLINSDVVAQGFRDRGTGFMVRFVNG